MTDAPLAFVDTETTGVHPGRRPWEIAIIRRDPDGRQTTMLAHITDVDLSEADPFGLRVGGFYQRHWEYTASRDNHLITSLRNVPDSDKSSWAGWAVREADAAPIVERLTRGAHIIGAVPNFDTETLDPMLRRHRLIPAWHYHLIDVEALAVGYLAGLARHGHSEVTCGPLCAQGGAEQAPLPWRSDDLSRACGVDPPSEDDRHTALGDALWAMRLYDAVTGGSGDRG